ncbi:MAG: hypothetical protein KGL59_05215 [Acidobacteriota bacterium]|nr:hypothetical protein [Acidobacteriota bacterium]
MSLLKNIWRPDEDPPRKGAGAHGDTVLTDRLAALLGRELDELQESSASGAQSLADRLLAQRESRSSESVGLETPTAPDIGADEKEPKGEPRRPASKPPSGRGTKGEDVATITRATEEAIEQLRLAQEQIESSLRERVEDYGRALETALNGVDHGAIGSERPIEEAAQEFRTEARQWFDEARRELRDQLDVSRASLADELRNHYTELLDTAQAKIEQLTRATVESGAPRVEDSGQIESWVVDQAETSRRQVQEGLQNLSRATEQAMARLQAVEERIETGFHDLEITAQAARQQDREQIEQWLKEQSENSRRQSEDGAKNLSEASERAMARLHAAEERIETSFRNQVEEYRRAVEVAAAELEKKGISQAKFQNAAEDLQRMTDQILERSAKRIEERTEQAMGRLTERLASAEQTLANSARAAMQGALEEQQQRIAEAWEQRSRAAIDTVTKAGDQGRIQLESARKTAEEQLQIAAREQGRRLIEETTAELRGNRFRDELVADARKQIEQAARELVSRSAGELGKQSEMALSGLSGALDKTAEKFIAETQQRLDVAGRGWLETAGQSVQQEYQTRISRWLDEQTDATRRRADEISRGFGLASEQAAARLETISRETESALRGRLQEQQKQWLESALDEARKSGFERKVMDQALVELEKNAVRFLEQSSRQLVEQADTSRAAITREMEGASRKLLEGVEASLENISWQHRGRLAQWWEERSQTARRESETNAQGLAQAAQQAASQLRTVQSEIEADLKNRARDHQAHLLDSAMEEMRKSGAIERAISEATNSLRTNANEVLSRSTQQIREHAESARMTVENQATASRRNVAEEIARKVEEAQSSVEAAGKAVTEDYRRQLSVWWEERTQAVRRESEETATHLNRSARQAAEQIQTVRKEMESEIQSGMQNYRKGLREAAMEELRRQGFQRDMLESITAELDKTARELAERSTLELQRHVDTALASLDEKMKTSRQGFIDDSQKKLSDLTHESMEMATRRFHEMLTRNVQDLEREQEEWLQRKRETVWLEINQHSPSGSRKGSAPLEKDGKAAGDTEDSGGILGRLFMGVAIIALAAAITVIILRFMPIASAKKAVVMQLKTDPPAGFVVQNPAWGAKERARQYQLSQAYWMLAVNDLEHKYPYGTALPDTPPPEFRVDQGGLKDDAATRRVYWDKFRQLWNAPGDWNQVTTSSGGLSGVFDWLENKLTQPLQPASTTQAN